MPIETVKSIIYLSTRSQQFPNFLTGKQTYMQSSAWSAAVMPGLVSGDIMWANQSFIWSPHVMLFRTVHTCPPKHSIHLKKFAEQWSSEGKTLLEAPSDTKISSGSGSCLIFWSWDLYMDIDNSDHLGVSHDLDGPVCIVENCPGLDLLGDMNKYWVHTSAHGSSLGTERSQAATHMHLRNTWVAMYKICTWPIHLHDLHTCPNYVQCQVHPNLVVPLHWWETGS